jgi:hypothetical protein
MIGMQAVESSSSEAGFTPLLCACPSMLDMQAVESSWSKASTTSSRTGQNINLVRWKQLEDILEEKVGILRGR